MDMVLRRLFRGNRSRNGRPDDLAMCSADLVRAQQHRQGLCPREGVMSLLFPLKFNAAVASIGINPNAFPKELRRKVQDFAIGHRLTPEEGALILMSQLGIGAPIEELERAMMVWRYERKVNFHNEHVRNALDQMGYDTS
ncbi:MAG: hypothetical protein ACNA7N_16585, partial [Yoonia sp.]